MDQRIRFISHQGKQILLVDFSHRSASEVEKIARTVPDHVTLQPRGSVLVLVDFTGASLDRDAIWVMKESAVFDKPYVKKSAWIGVASLPEDFCQEIKKFSGRELPVFVSREQALTWLAGD
jgi:hypothetical protein